MVTHGSERVNTSHTTTTLLLPFLLLLPLLRLLNCIVNLLDDNEVSVSGKNTKAPLGVEVLYGAFKKWGYQTFFQEDLCWYDIWGSVLTDIERRAMPKTNSEYRTR